jgi:hypothetical protein
MRGNYFTGNNGIASSSNMLEFHQTRYVLFEYNNVDHFLNQGNTAPLSFKEYGNKDVIVRFNKLWTNKDRAMGWNWPESSGLYLYGNYFYGSGNTHPNVYAFDMFDGATNANVWSNIFRDHSLGGILVWYGAGRQPQYSPERRVQNLKVYNNTFHNNATGGGAYLDRTALSIGDTAATGIIVKNNIFSNNRPSESDRRQISNQIGSNLALEHNTYFHSGGSPTVYHFGADRTIATLQGSYQREDDSPAGAVANPGLNANGTLNGTHINNGANLSGLVGSVTVHGTAYNMYWQTALHPSTDWTGQPSAAKIITADQTAHGVGWERGAYVYQQ